MKWTLLFVSLQVKKYSVNVLESSTDFAIRLSVPQPPFLFLKNQQCWSYLQLTPANL